MISSESEGIEEVVKFKKYKKFQVFVFIIERLFFMELGKSRVNRKNTEKFIFDNKYSEDAGNSV